VGSADGAGVHFSSRYDFAPDRIAIAWKVTRSRTDPLSLEAMLPSWGEAAISAILKSGVKARLTGQRRTARKSTWRRSSHFLVDGGEGGYAAVPGQFPAGAIAYLLTPSEQSSNPRPGPSIAVRLARSRDGVSSRSA
jgi:hypothetical protein